MISWESTPQARLVPNSIHFVNGAGGLAKVPCQVLPDDSSRFEREMKRIKVTLSKNIHKEALSMIDKANKDLRDITHQNIYLEPIRKKRRSKRPLAELKVIRQYAASLHHVFITGKAWRCRCRLLHMASLRLESRPEPLGAASDDAAPNVKFRILLSTREEGGNYEVTSKWQEVEVIPSLAGQVAVAITVGPQPSTRSVNVGPGPGSITMAVSPEEPAIGHDCGSISDICSALCVSHLSKKAIGYLVDEEDDKHKHYLFRTNTMISPKTRSMSLGDVLSGWHGSLSPPLLRSDRLQIAVTLASSVLQLDGTSWLESEWSSDDIFFHDNSNQPTQSSYSYPYLSWKHCINDVDTPGSFNTVSHETYAVRSKVLFALGITLIELCFGKRIVDMCVPEDEGQNEAIYRLCGSVYSEMGSSYGDAVRRCLYQPFDVREISFDNEEVQQKVFDDIVTPLSDDLNIFLGKSRTY